MQRGVGGGVEPPGIPSGGAEGVLGKPPTAGVALEWAVSGPGICSEKSSY